MKIVYCSNCGTRLNITRKAMPKLGRIIDIVEYHVCPDEPVEFDLTPIDLPTFVEDKENNKFIKSLNDLHPQSVIGASGLQDRRPSDQVKSTAPSSLDDLMKSLGPSTPANDINEEPDET